MTKSVKQYSDLVIIGNGVAGNNASLVARSRNQDMKITIISREPHNEYAPGALPEYLSGALSREDMFIKSTSDYEINNIDKLFGVAVDAIDYKKKVVKLSEGNITYDKLIIATGSTPIVPPVKGHDLPGNFVFKTLDDTDAMIEYPGKNAVVVGSGAIGLEAALALKSRGYENVTLIELKDWIVPNSFDEKPARMMEKELKDFGVNVLTGEKVTAVQGKKHVTGVSTDKNEISCDVVVWAVGVKPNVNLAQTAGVKLGTTGGIAVNEYMQTNLSDIYACGDCVESTDIFSGQKVLNLLWDAACKQGRVAGSSCTGGNVTYPGSYAVLLSHIGEVPVLSFGLNASHLKNQEYQTLEKVIDNKYQRLIMKEDELVGVQMVGTLEGSGPVLFHLKKGAKRADLREVYANPSLAKMDPRSVMLNSFIDKFTVGK
ncbi:MAG TPA: FAD-dependent oxidoreductase [Syntrophomonadaceae bacterium]|nr:FAD-dependent oxidoreductase [Syntrophomonadaceae bacterium]